MVNCNLDNYVNRQKIRFYEMNKKALHVLEYDKIIEKLAEHATSDPGRKLCLELEPSSDIKEIRKNLQKTNDAIARIFKKGSVNFGDNKEFGGILKALKIGSSLDMASLLRLASFLDNVNRVKSYGRPPRDDEEGDSLTESFQMLEPLFQSLHHPYKSQPYIADVGRRDTDNYYQKCRPVHSITTFAFTGSTRQFSVKYAIIPLFTLTHSLPFSCVSSVFKKVSL